MAEKHADQQSRILVIDDNPAIHEDIRRILQSQEVSEVEKDLAALEKALFAESRPVNHRSSYRVDSALSGQEGLDLVQKAVRENDPYVLAIVDMRMPTGWDGLETIEHIWLADPHVQTVLCTAYSDRGWDEICARLGETDRLLILKKPFDPIEILQIAATMTAKYRLSQSLRAQMELLEQRVAQRTLELQRANEALYEEIVQRRAIEQRLMHDVTHDALTGLANRQALMDNIQQAMKWCRRDPNYGFALLLIDLDDFKVVNDSLGHDTGDEVLKAFAQRLRHEARAVDTVARLIDTQSFRLGGDEFVILLEGVTNAQDALAAAERLKHTASQTLADSGHKLVHNMSVGIVLSRSDYQSPEQMLRDADIALYQAKNKGKNRCQVFDRSMYEALQNRLELQEEFRLALRDQSLDVHYQPIVCLGSGQLIGFEALTRWHHKQRGWISPAQFMPIAELSGLVIPLGTFVIERVCRDLTNWRRLNPAWRQLWVSVNISPRQFLSQDLAELVRRFLNEYGLDPGAIHLEITETSLMEHQGVVGTAIEKLRSCGIALALDDFGTGYSSLSHLQELPISTVKIDHKFVRQLRPNDRASAATVHAIIELAHNRNLKVVAEGIETADQLLQLQSMSCDYGQGFLFSPAIPAEQAVQRYLEHPATTPFPSVQPNSTSPARQAG